MGTISRHGNAPFVNGETLDGDELEADFNTIYDEFNGNIENANVKPGANIDGSKLLDDSVASAKLESDSVTVAKMIAAAVPKHYVDHVASVGALTQSTSLADFPGLTSASLTPGSTSDMIFMDVCFDVDWAASPSTASTLTVAWSIDGVETDDVLDCTVAGAVTADLGESVHSTFAALAPSATSIVIKPRFKTASASAKVPTVGSLVFRCWILPGK